MTEPAPTQAVAPADPAALVAALAGPAPAEAAVVAAIAAAVDQVWPRPHVAASTEPAGPPPWRFSGRWWARPTVARRDRPA